MVKGTLDFLRTYAALITFLVSYFLLTVLGNLFFFLPFGDQLGNQTIIGFSIGNFSTAGSPGYWVLLFLPFVVAPPLVILVRRIAVPIASGVASLPALSKLEYLLILLCGYVYAGWSLWRVDAVGMLMRAHDFSGAVQDRFHLIEQLGFWPLAVLKSVLIALSCYGFIRMLRSRGMFWTVVAGFNVIVMSVMLLLLNMKWPLVLFYLAHLVSIALFSRRKVIPFILFVVLACTSYFSTSLLLSRSSILPTVAITNPTLPPASSVPSSAIQPTIDGTIPRHSASSVIIVAAGAILNRMAQPFPYYYEIFAASAGKCGTLVTRIMREKSPCQPSNVVYSAMFMDRFAGKGTAPQSAHVTGFALSGWPGAILELIALSVVLGVFAAIAGTSSPWQPTITVLGVLTGYYFSQLPFEGPIVYDHGILWWLPLLVFVGVRKALTARETKPA